MRTLSMYKVLYREHRANVTNCNSYTCANVKLIAVVNLDTVIM